MRRLRLVSVVCAGLCASMAGVHASAQMVGGMDLLGMLARADADQDGRVSEEEFFAVFPFMGVMIFPSLDVNHDGFLSIADLIDPNTDDISALVARIIGMSDANGDGEVTLDEIHAILPGLSEEDFLLLDRNVDGVISIEDLETVTGPERIIRALIEEWFRAADTDLDGHLSLDEFLAQAPGLSPELFATADRDGDGMIALEEVFAVLGSAVAVLGGLADVIDANGDASLSLEELRAVIPEFPEALFDALDRNDDGLLSREDIPGPPPDDRIARLLALLAEVDTNQDGVVTFEEAQAFLPGFTQEAFAFLDRNGDGVLSPEDGVAGPPPGPRERLLCLLRHADANNDGVVTMDELHAVAPELSQDWFNLLDTNDDGVLSIDDLPDPPCGPLEQLIASLREADADGDGVVTYDELDAVIDSLTEDMFAAFDRNGDGVISAEDLPQPVRDPRDQFLQWLRQADNNPQDGQVSFDELAALLPGLTAERFSILDRNGDDVLTIDDLPDMPIPVDDPERLRLVRLLIHADVNQDGMLSFDEITEVFPDAPAELLSRMDLDGNGLLTRDEIMAALAHSESGQELVVPSDVDADGLMTAVDIQAAVNHVLGGLSRVLPPDVNGDGAVDALDIQVILNALLAM